MLQLFFKIGLVPLTIWTNQSLPFCSLRYIAIIYCFNTPCSSQIHYVLFQIAQKHLPFLAYFSEPWLALGVKIGTLDYINAH